MKITNENIKELIKEMGFIPEDGTSDVFYKKYVQHQDYVIRVNFNSKKIEYRNDNIKQEDGIQLGDLTTSNFESSENFVVLECVNRLLEKGYAPDKLHLEHKFPLGRNEKGKLDVLVYDNNNKAYLMVECKTWGVEFSKEQKKMQKDGGQLFSYFVQDKSAKYLCLYASKLSNKNIEYKNDIIKVDEEWTELSNQKEIHDHWNKNTNDNGIFEEWANAYDVEVKALIRGRLQPLTKDDSGRIFNQFAEILRHNVVSDKPNAFNKILNLFICKIIDEDKNDFEQVEFQWLEDDTDESLQMRLNDLYKKGMHRFLDIDVTDFSDSEIASTLLNVDDANAQKTIRDMFTKLRLQKNPEFAFIEVYDENSFKLNARVVREVVELLQPYQFRYGHKQQFLGDFFELLLNTSIKQEAGQYFTPVPITKYIISALPIKEFINEKIKTDDPNILPSVIDFACGTGHFLTEYMDKVQSVIENEIDINKAKPSAKGKLRGWKDYNKFEWAGDYVYGIDADYRLVKSSKVNSFLNGDGEANIMRANGLDHFTKSKEYKGKLKVSSGEDARDNAQFDILIANPPYSVNAFKSTVKYGSESFELFDKFTDKSSEIECLFIERMKQLLKVGGYAAIILPSSILNNVGVYTLAREFVLKYFKIIAITEFGTNTFMATNTNTVTLFLERRPNTDYKIIHSAVNQFFEKNKDVTVLGIENAFGKYVSNTFENVDFSDYISFINGIPSKNILASEIYDDYLVWFYKQKDIKKLQESKKFLAMSESEQTSTLNKLLYEKIIANEKEKMIYFLLAYGQKTVVTKVGEKQEEKEFLGYEFSTTRGHEGIKMLSDGTRLYDENDQQNIEKANYYVYKAFLNEYPEIDESLQDNISLIDTFLLLKLQNVPFEKNINLNANVKLMFNTKYPLDKMSKGIQISKGVTYDKKDQVYRETTNTILTADNISINNHLDLGIDKKVYLDEDFVISENSKLCADDIFICLSSGSRKHIGKVAYIASDTNCYAGGFMGIIRPNKEASPNNILIPKYIYTILSMKNTREYFSKMVGGSNIKNLNDAILDIRIPYPPESVQNEIVNKISDLEKMSEMMEEQIQEYALKKKSILSSVQGPKIPLGTLVDKITERVSEDDIESENYINTNTMVKNCGGILKYSGKLPAGTYVRYLENDILMSNIRPYLKKVWHATYDGGCSPDVFVFRIKDPLNVNGSYLSALMKQEEFFDFVMQDVKGVKMPRGKEEHILNYKITVPQIGIQMDIAKKIDEIENEISRLTLEISKIEKTMETELQLLLL